MRTEYFLFVHHTTSHLVKFSTWRFDHSGDISYSLLVNPNHPDQSWEGQNTCLWIYALDFFIEHPGEHWWEHNIFCSITIPQTVCQSLAPGALSTLVTSVVLYTLNEATPMSPGKDKTRVCAHTLWILSLTALQNTDENRIYFVHSQHHKHFCQAKHLVLWGIWWHQLFSTR